MTPPPIVQGSPSRSPKTSVADVLPVFVTVFLIVMIVATAITFILPESYDGTARVQVAEDGYFIQTAFEIIRSQVVLDKAIEKLNLNVIWGKKYFNGETLKTAETREILKRRLNLAPMRNTRIIAITVYSDDRNEAPLIANAIAEVYRDHATETQKTAEANNANPSPAISTPVEIIDRATPASQPCKPNKPLNIALGAVAGMILGAGVAGLVWVLRGR